jgi:hypothetical protein
MIGRAIRHIVGRWYEVRAKIALERNEFDDAARLFERSRKYFSSLGASSGDRT